MILNASAAKGALSLVSRGSLERLRAANQRTVLGLLGAEGPTSRADLVRSSGLSRTTVSSLIADLIRTGHVVETADRGRPHKGGSGRPPVLVALSAPAGAVAGVDVGHGHVRIAVDAPLDVQLRLAVTRENEHTH